MTVFMKLYLILSYRFNKNNTVGKIQSFQGNWGEKEDRLLNFFGYTVNVYNKDTIYLSPKNVERMNNWDSYRVFKTSLSNVYFSTLHKKAKSGIPKIMEFIKLHTGGLK